MSCSALCLWCSLAVATAQPSAAEILLHDARARARHGDHQGTRVLAERALQLEGDHQRTAQYLIARAWEFEGEPQRAIEIYEALLAAWPPRQAPEDLVFRASATLGRLQRHAEARRLLRWLNPVGQRPELDQLKIELLRGTWALEGGHRRRGRRRLARALDGAAPELAPTQQADARLAVLQSAVRRAETLSTATERGLQRRAIEIEVGNVQLAAIVRLDEPRQALQGFLDLGRAHEAFGASMREASPYPEPLNTERVEGVWTKATMFYDRALSYASLAGWSSEPLPTLRGELADLVQQVDALAAP